MRGLFSGGFRWWAWSLSGNPLGHDGMSFRAGQGGCSGGNTQGGLSPGQTTPPGAKRHTTRCGHGGFCPAAVFLARAETVTGIGPGARLADRAEPAMSWLSGFSDGLLMNKNTGAGV